MTAVIAAWYLGAAYSLSLRRIFRLLGWKKRITAKAAFLARSSTGFCTSDRRSVAVPFAGVEARRENSGRTGSR